MISFFSMSQNLGKLIVIEGTDGSGKATQSKLLLDYLKKQKISHAYFDFPQYHKSFFGRFIGKFLRGELGDAGNLNPYLISLPYAVDRWQAGPAIKKALLTKKLVICNRYASSNLAYQVSRAKPALRYNLFRWLKTLEYKEFGIPKENLVLFLYVPYQISMQLIQQKQSRQYLKGKQLDINESNTKLLKQVDETYLWLLKKNPHWVRVDCIEKNQLLSRQEIHQRIVRTLQDHKCL